MDGGLPPRAAYLVKGQPGTGKTTLGLQFLVEGVRSGEKCLYLCLAETRGQLTGIAEAYGLTLDGVEIHEMRRRSGADGDPERPNYTVFNPSEVELEEILHELLEQLDRVKPARLVLDSLSEIRLLAEDAYRFRREMLSLCDRITASNCTALLIDVETDARESNVAETLASGVIRLELLSPEYGGARRRVSIRKMRASQSVGGFHDFTIRDRGIEIYPRLVAAPHRAAHLSAALPTGVGALDALLGGGLDAGTSTVLVGPAGSGKSTIAALFLASAAERGEPGAMFCFDESPTNLLLRTDALGIPLSQHARNGRAQIMAIDPAEFSPGELSYRVKQRVDDGARIIVLDSINGYLNALPQERFLSAHLHELLAFLSEKGIATILTLAQHGLLATHDTRVEISYVADTVVLFRYFEVDGAVKQAVSVLKKRTGNHERSIRELRFESDGVHIGLPLTHLRGVLGGDLGDISGAPARGDHETRK